MINDKIRFAAKVLEDFWERPRPDGIEKGLRGPDPEEYLRAIFMAGVTIDRDYRFVRNWLAELEKKLERADDPVALLDAKRLMEVLEDEDIFDPARRSATYDSVCMECLYGFMRSEPLLACVERIWKPVYDEAVSNALWIAALREDSSVPQLRRLVERASPEGVDLVALVLGLRSAQALRALAAALSDAQLEERIKTLLAEVAKNASASGYQREGIDAMVVVLSAEVVRRTACSPDGVADFVGDLLERREEFSRVLSEVLPEFMQLAKSVGCIDSPKTTAMVASVGVRRLPLEQLREMLELGLAVSVDRPKSELYGGLHLLSGASPEQVPLIASRMNESQRLDFMSFRLPDMLNKEAMRWDDGVSCIDDNLLVDLHRQGFDLGVDVPLYKDGGAGIFARAASDSYSSGEDGYSKGRYYYPRQFIFTALHALGLRDREERLDGMTALHLAAIQDDDKAIQALAALGHDLDAKAAWTVRFRHNDRKVDWEGDTPLVLAVRHGCERAFQALVECGADLGVKAGTGASLMQLAKTESLKRLIRASRTGAAVSKAMSGGAESSKKLDGLCSSGIL